MTQCINWGITGSVVGGKRIKPRLDVKSYETKYEAIMAVEKSAEAKNQIAADFGIPIST
jgi:phosphate/sulfate permease